MRLTPQAVSLAFLLFGVAWAGGNPPAAAPDEQAHFVKAYATAAGQFDGQALPVRETQGEDLRSRSARWIETTTRSFRIPARLVPPPGVSCYAFDRERTADCQSFPPTVVAATGEALADTHVGTYNPFPYFPSGLAIQGAEDFRSAMLRGRLGSLVSCALLVAWAAILAGRRGRFALLGLVCAVTPMVVFLSASLNTSGLEISGAILFWSAAMSVFRSRETPRLLDWCALAVGGVVFALTRPLGAILLSVAAVVIAWFTGIPVVRATVRREPVKAAIVGLLLTVSGAVSFLWAHSAVPHPSIDFQLAVMSLGQAFKDLPNQAREVIGIFGWNDTTMPLGAYLVGLGTLGCFGVAGLLMASRRERLAFVGLGFAIVAIDVALAVLVEAQIGFGMQARYLLPLVVGLPTMAGEVLEDQSHRLPRNAGYWAATVVLPVWGLLHLVAFLSNQHRYAMGRSAAWGIPWDSRWSPDGGLSLWLGFAIVGCILMIYIGVITYLHASVRPTSRS